MNCDVGMNMSSALVASNKFGVLVGCFPTRSPNLENAMGRLLIPDVLASVFFQVFGLATNFAILIMSLNES